MPPIKRIRLYVDLLRVEGGLIMEDILKIEQEAYTDEELASIYNSTVDLILIELN